MQKDRASYFSQCKISTCYHRFVDLITIYPLRHSDSFYLLLVLFLFDWWLNRWEIAEEVLMDCTTYICYISLMAKCMCTDYQAECFCCVLIQWFKSARIVSWFHVETYMCVLGLWFANTAVAKIVIRHCYYRLVYHFHHVWVTFYAWTNRLTHLSTCNLPCSLCRCYC